MNSFKSDCTILDCMKSLNTRIRKWMHIFLWHTIYKDICGIFSAGYEGISSPLLHLLASQLHSYVLFHGTEQFHSSGDVLPLPERVCVWECLRLGPWVRHTLSSQREKLYPLLLPLLLYTLFWVPCNFFRGLTGLIKQYHSAQNILNNSSLFPTLNWQNELIFISRLEFFQVHQIMLNYVFSGKCLLVLLTIEYFN